MFSRRFTIRRTFDMNNYHDQDDDEVPVETHFGVPWSVHMVQGFEAVRKLFPGEKRASWLVVKLPCHNDVDENHPWSISVKGTCRIDNGDEEDEIKKTFETTYGNNEYNYKIKNVCNWKTMMEKYVKNDKLTVEIDVVITEMKGIVPKRKLNFDEPEADISDVVLAVGDRKFHVSKVILGKFSDFFKPLFFNGYKESKQSEIKLEGVDPDTFQILLEVIYGELESIQEETVEKILHLARQYQVRVVTNRCIDFMIDKADVPLDKKFRLASTYNLVDLQDHLLEDIKSKKDSDDRLTKSSKYMSDSFIAKMIRKVYE